MLSHYNPADQSHAHALFGGREMKFKTGSFDREIVAERRLAGQV